MSYQTSKNVNLSRTVRLGQKKPNQELTLFTAASYW